MAAVPQVTTGGGKKLNRHAAILPMQYPVLVTHPWLGFTLTDEATRTTVSTSHVSAPIRCPPRPGRRASFSGAVMALMSMALIHFRPFPRLRLLSPPPLLPPDSQGKRGNNRAPSRSRPPTAPLLRVSAGAGAACPALAGTCPTSSNLVCVTPSLPSED